MYPQEALPDFLRTRRARLQPEDVGLPNIGRRQVPGLRREEVAFLTGVSADYYTRLEQGRARNVSSAIIKRLAHSLRLSDDERLYLFDLVYGSRRLPGCPVAPPLPASDMIRDVTTELRSPVRHLVDAYPYPAYVLNRRGDFVAHNRIAAELFGTAISETSNLARLMFLTASVTPRFADWPQLAGTVVEFLRFSAGRYPHDVELSHLIDELSAGSAAFRQMWSRHDVADHTQGHVVFRHPDVGDIALHCESLRLTDSSDHVLVCYVPEPGSPAADALSIIGSWSAPSVTRQA